MKLKRLTAAMLSVVLVISMLSGAGMASQAEGTEVQNVIFNAYESYQTEINANGVWTYAALSGGVYTDLIYDAANSRWSEKENGNVRLYGVTTDMVTGNPALAFRAESPNTDVVLVFTAPYSGELMVSMTNGGVFAPHNSDDEVSFTLKHNDTTVRTVTNLDNGYNAQESRFFQDAENLTVQEGDKLYFIVHRNAYVANPLTYFNPEIAYTEMEDKVLDYNAYHDYSEEKNPNGAWTFSYLKDGGYTNLTYDSTNGYWGITNPGRIHTTDHALVSPHHDQVTGNPTLVVRPEATTTDTAVRFTIPHSGTIEVSMANGGVFAPHNGGDEVAFTFKLNETIVKSVSDLDASYNTAGNRFFADTVELKVQTGDTLDFIVHRNKAVADPRTYFNPHIRYVDVENDKIAFDDDAKVLVSNMTLNSFKVTWPTVTNGSENVVYSVYISETAFGDVPMEGGIAVSGQEYTFTEIDYRKAYYVAVVAEEGNQTAMITSDVISVRDDLLTYDAYEDYSPGAANPNGVWTYASLKGGTYTDLIYDTANGRWSEKENGSVRLYTVKSDTVTGNPALALRAESPDTDAVLVFTAPYTGKLTVSMANGGVFAPYNSGDEVTFAMRHNNMTKMKVTDLDSSYNVVGSRFFSEPMELTINKGDKIRFIVHRNGYIANPTTYMNPKIRYTELMDYDLVNFAPEAEITVSNVTTEGFRVAWPSAEDGVGTYSYKVYLSETPFEGEPTENGIAVDGTEYIFTGLDSKKTYYVAVVAADSISTAVLLLNDGICITEEILTFCAYENYSTSQNPNGVWSYLQGTAGNYRELSYLTDKDRWGSDDGWLNAQTGGAATVTGKPAICIRPESTDTDTVLAFTAPYTGIVSISMANGGVFASHQSGDEVTFTLKHNDTVVRNVSDLDAGYNAEGSRYYTDTVIRSVKEGDRLYFIVHRNKAVADPRTYLNPEIVYMEVGEEVLQLPGDAEIEVSRVRTDGFTVTWPQAAGGTGDYRYTVYCSKTPFNGVYEKGGIEVDGTSYTFTGLTFREYYYVAVVVNDGTYQLALEAPEAIRVFSDMFLFDAYKDFTEGTQNGVWQYLYTPGGTMELSELSWNESRWGDNVLGTVEAVDREPVTGQNALLMNPGTGTDVVVAFTAPYTGEISVSMANGGIYVPLNGAGDNFDGINFTMKLNEEQIVNYAQVSSKQMHPASVNPQTYIGRVFTENVRMNVKEGDVLYFIVNKNGSLHNDSTYYNPRVEYLSVDDSTLNLRFGGNKTITAVNITKSSMTVNWPEAIGGTGEYNYVLYVSDMEITELPLSGGINMGSSTSYSMGDLTPYTDYYFAVTVDDGENQVTLKSGAISTIGNTYSYDSVEDYTDEMQPISSPWRYYWEEAESKELEELAWDAENKVWGDTSTATLQKVESDLVTGNPALKVVPVSGKNAVIAFIAPFSGTVVIDMSNGGVFAPYNGAAQEWDGINFALKKNDEVLYSRNGVNAKYMHSDRCMAAGLTVEIKAGDVLYFTVNNNRETPMDMTFLAPRVNYTYVNEGSDTFGFLPGATVKATEVTKNGMTLNWSEAFSPEGREVLYEIWISASPITKQPSSQPVYSGKHMKTTLKGLEFATRYYVYVVATESTGKTDVLIPEDTVMTECPVYDAYKQYSEEKNEAGAWNYAIRSKNAETEEFEYTLLTYSEDTQTWGDSENGMIHKSDKDPVTGNPSMYAHPGTKKQEAALVFTAPYSGFIRVTMNNGGVFAPYNGKDQDYDGINFLVYHGEKEIWNLEKVSAKNNPADQRLGTEIIELSVEEGEKIYFLVGANSSNAADGTYFNPYIEYLEVTGGNGVVKELEGFVFPEPEKVYAPVFRENNVTKTDGLAVILEHTLTENVLPWIIILPLYCGVILITSGIIVICLVKLRKKKEAKGV